MKNTFGWVHLTTTDAKGAKDFYEHLFRWKITTKEGAAGKSFFEIDAGEGPCAGIQQKKEKDQSQCAETKGECSENKGECQARTEGKECKCCANKCSSHWIPFVSVSDIHEYEKKAKDLGAEVVIPVMDLGHEQGFISVILDPTGAVIGMHAKK